MIGDLQPVRLKRYNPGGWSECFGAAPNSTLSTDASEVRSGTTVGLQVPWRTPWWLGYWDAVRERYGALCVRGGMCLRVFDGKAARSRVTTFAYWDPAGRAFDMVIAPRPAIESTLSPVRPRRVCRCIGLRTSPLWPCAWWCSPIDMLLLPPLVVGFGTGYTLAGRSWPGWAGAVEALLPVALSWVGYSLAMALFADIASRLFILWFAVIPAVAGLRQLRRKRRPAAPLTLW